MNEIKSKLNDFNNQPDFSEMIKKIEALKKSGTVDLSTEEDLSIAVMNLISLEEHFFFTAEKTGKDEYFEMLQTVREMRKELLGRMIKSYEGEVWCIAKHLLAASMRLLEVGTKMQTKGDLDDAKDIFEKSYELFNLFFVIRLKMVDIVDLKKDDNTPWTKDDILSKLVDCCKE